MLTFARIVVGIVLLAVLLALAGVGLAWRRDIAPVARAEPSSIDPALVEAGARLAAVGNCIACHTVPGGEAFAGGLAVPTQFGTIHSTNITPDEETGIGAWSEEAFARAMHEGVDRAGRHLYPAFPYDHFTLVTPEDNRALFAYLMTRQPVSSTAPENDLAFPYNIRMALAGWKLLFLDEGVFEPDPAKDETWNRGAYLAEGLAHCGACHTPRNALGARDQGSPSGRAARRRAGPPIRSTRIRPRRCRGTSRALHSTSATAGMRTTAFPAGRWRRSPETSGGCPTRTSSRSRPIPPT